MRLIRARMTESNNVADRTLYTRARSDQLLNIWVLVPLLFFSISAAPFPFGAGLIYSSLAPATFA
jgi:hypothetical protein